MKLPLVSIIIPVYNDAERLSLCLKALEQQTYTPYEVIVVDNGSEGNDVETVCKSFENVTFATESKQGSYAARNKGLSLAEGKIIAFTDSDCIPEPVWLEKGIERFLAAANCGLVGGSIRIFPKDPERPTTAELYEMLLAFPQEKYIKSDNYGATANVFTSRAVLDKVGPFNDNLQSGGDMEWGKRVAAEGFTLVYAEEVCINHPARHTFAELQTKAHRIIRGHYRIDSRTSTLRRYLREYLKPPVRLLLSVLQNGERKLTLRQKVRVCFAVMGLRWFKAAEVIKLWVAKPISLRK